MEEAQEGRLIEELPQRAGQYKFAHMLTQETLSEELSLTRRVRLHAQIGETLEELYGAGAEVHAAELAYHFVQAETATGAEKLVKYTLLAGEQALAYFQRALAAKEGQPVDAETAAALFGLARSQAAAGRRLQVLQELDNLKQSFEYYAGVGDVDRAVAEFPVPGFVLQSDLAINQQL